MSTTIEPADWRNNMSVDDRKVWIQDQIAKWIGEKKIDECLSALELGNLSMTEKMVGYRSVLIVGSIRHCRHNPRVEARIPILTLIVYLSDNAKGTCHLSISKMQELLMRSRQCIVDNILALEADGSIGIARIEGMLNCYWPRIPTALVEMSPNPTWFVEAVTGSKSKVYRTVDEAIAAATNDQSSGVDRSSRADQSSRVDRHRSSAVDRASQLQQTNQSSPAGEPVKSSTDSISSLNLFSSSQRGREPPVEMKKPIQPKQASGRREMNLALGGEAAYAEVNITVSPSGKLSIGPDFRAELQQTFTDEQINAGLDCTLAAMAADRNKVRIMQQIRRQCVYRKQDAAKVAPRKPGITGRSGRPSL